MKKLNLRLDAVEQEVSASLGIAIEDLKGRSREPVAQTWRHACMFLEHHHGEASCTEIGERFGRHHTSVINSLNFIIDGIDTKDDILMDAVRKLPSHLSRYFQKGIVTRKQPKYKEIPTIRVTALHLRRVAVNS